MKYKGNPFKPHISCLITLLIVSQGNIANAQENQSEEQSVIIAQSADPIAEDYSDIASEKKIASLQTNAIENSIIAASSAQQDDPSQNSPQQNEPTDQAIFVGSIIVSGSDNLTAANFSEIIENNIGLELQEEALRSITQQVADQAREDGFLFAKASIPEQSLKLGILQIAIDDGRIDEIRIIGSDNKALRKLLAALEGKTAIKKEVERKLILANDIPKIVVQKTRFLNENGKNILEVNVTERSNRVSVSADNYGTENFGPVRARLSFDYEGLFSDSDAGTVSVRTNPVDPQELVFFSANHTIAVGNSGTRLGISGSAGQTQPGSFGSFGDIDGDSRFVSIFASHPITRSNNSSLWLNTNAAFLKVEQEVAGALLRVDTQVTYSIGLSSNNKLLGGRLRAGTTITQGVGILGTTRLGNPLSSRFDGDGVFTKGSLFLNWRGQISGNLGLQLSGFGQVANRPLLASQELNIGGAFNARGFNFAAISGENGFTALAELNYNINKPLSWIRRLQPYIFIDGGYADNIDNGFGSGSLLSSGLGIRADIGRLNFEVEGAFPIHSDRFIDDDNPQLNLSIGYTL